MSDESKTTHFDQTDDKDETSASTFVPGETPVVDPGTTIPPFLGHSDVSGDLETPATDEPEPLNPRFEVVDGGTVVWDALVADETETESQLEDEAADEHRIDAAAKAREIAASASAGMRAMGSALSQGANAVRKVNEAKKALGDARAELENLDGRIAAQEQELAQRTKVEASFDQIVAAQNAVIERAQQEITAAETKRDGYTDAIEALKQRLQQMHDDDAQTEKRLKAATEAAEAQEAASREASKRLTRRLDDAKRLLTKAEEEERAGVAAAEETITSNKARLETLRQEYAELQRNPSANSANYSVRISELNREISDATDKLREATEGLPTLKQTLAQEVENAKVAVRAAQEPIDEARRSHEGVTDSADNAREALLSAKEDASERQRALRAQIAEAEKNRRTQEDAIEKSKQTEDTARSVIARATEIHEHPEITQALAGALERDKREREEALSEVSRLTETEADVRESTRSSRMRFIAMIGAAALIIVVIVVLVAALTR